MVIITKSASAEKIFFKTYKNITKKIKKNHNSGLIDLSYDHTFVKYLSSILKNAYSVTIFI